MHSSISVELNSVCLTLTRLAGALGSRFHKNSLIGVSYVICSRAIQDKSPPSGHRFHLPAPSTRAETQRVRRLRSRNRNSVGRATSQTGRRVDRPRQTSRTRENKCVLLGTTDLSMACLVSPYTSHDRLVTFSVFRDGRRPTGNR